MQPMTQGQFLDAMLAANTNGSGRRQAGGVYGHPDNAIVTQTTKVEVPVPSETMVEVVREVVRDGGAVGEHLILQLLPD